MGINNFHKDVWLKVVKNSTYGTGDYQSWAKGISYNWNPFGAIKGTEINEIRKRKIEALYEKI
jgi:hypothetical protein